MDLAQTRETYGQADYTWLASQHGVDAALPRTLKISTLTKNTHYPDGILPAGTPLGEIETTVSGTKEVGLYDNSATDGREVLWGFTLEPVKVTGNNDVVVPVHWHGAINQDKLPFAIDAAGVLDIAGRFLVVSSQQGGS